MVIAPPGPPTFHARHGVSQFWIEGLMQPWWSWKPRWRRMTPKRDIAHKQPMPKGAIWDLGEHDTVPKHVKALCWYEDL